MPEIYKWGKILVAILKDGKVTKEELPEFMEALAGFVMAVVVVLAPLLKGQTATLAKRLAGGLSVAALAVKR